MALSDQRQHGHPALARSHAISHHRQRLAPLVRQVLRHKAECRICFLAKQTAVFSTSNHIVKPGAPAAIEQGGNTLARFGMFRGVVHFHEGFMALMLHDGSVVAALEGLEEPSADKPFMFAKLPIGLDKPLTKLGILAWLNGWEIDDDNEHGACLVCLVGWKFIVLRT